MAVVDAHVARDLRDAGLGGAVDVVARETPTTPWIEATLTIAPPPPASMRRTATAVPYIGPCRSTRSPRSMCSASTSCAPEVQSMPALLTHARSVPAASAASAARSCVDQSPMSPVTALASPPRLRERALERLGVPVDADDVVAVGGQPLRDREPDPHRGARDDRARPCLHAASRGRPILAPKVRLGTSTATESGGRPVWRDAGPEALDLALMSQATRADIARHGRRSRRRQRPRARVPARGDRPRPRGHRRHRRHGRDRALEPRLRALSRPAAAGRERGRVARALRQHRGATASPSSAATTRRSRACCAARS